MLLTVKPSRVATPRSITMTAAMNGKCVKKYARRRWFPTTIREPLLKYSANRPIRMTAILSVMKIVPSSKPTVPTTN